MNILGGKRGNAHHKKTVCLAAEETQCLCSKGKWKTALSNVILTFLAPYTLTQSGKRTMGILESRSHFLINIGLFQTNAVWSYCLNRVWWLRLETLLWLRLGRKILSFREMKALNFRWLNQNSIHVKRESQSSLRIWTLQSEAPSLDSEFPFY